MKWIQLLILVSIFTVVAKGEEGKESTNRIVCYRNRNVVFDSNANCTHIVVQIAKVDKFSAYMKDDICIDCITTSKPNVILLLGLDPIHTDIYVPQVISSKVGRKRLSRSVARLLQSYNVSGVDVKINENYMSETQLLIEDLRAEAKKYGFMLTAVLSTSKIPDIYSYNLNSICHNIGKNVDFISIQASRRCDEMQYFCETNLASPLYPSHSWSVSYWTECFLNAGVPSSKILLGIPGFATCFSRLKNADDNYIGASIDRKDISIKGKDFKDYVLLNSLTDSDWVRQRDNASFAPYATWYLVWVSYDDEVSVKAKVDYIKEKNLGGAMIWSLDEYDYWEPLPFVDILHELLSY